jgi:hypothetical protein
VENKCIDCGKKIWITSKRCQSCYLETIKGKNHPMYGIHKVGKLNPHYIDGSSLIKHDCIDCNKKISYNNWLHGNKRCRSCARIEEYKDPSNHPQWLGGISKLPYAFEFTEELKEQIRKRDTYICKNCGQTQEQELQQRKCKLAVHHIDYNKENCSKKNLITLCQICNTKVNSNRDYWFAYFNYMIGELNE